MMDWCNVKAELRVVNARGTLARAAFFWYCLGGNVVFVGYELDDRQ